MSIIATRKFMDDEGNAFFLKLVTGKRRPFVVRGLHGTVDGNKTGVLDAASDEQTAMAKLDALAAQAEAQGWREIHGRSRQALTAIPAPVNTGAVKSGGGGPQGGRPAKPVKRRR